MDKLKLKLKYLGNKILLLAVYVVAVLSLGESAKFYVSAHASGYFFLGIYSSTCLMLAAYFFVWSFKKILGL